MWCFDLSGLMFKYWHLVQLSHKQVFSSLKTSLTYVLFSEWFVLFSCSSSVLPEVAVKVTHKHSVWCGIRKKHDPLLSELLQTNFMNK